MGSSNKGKTGQRSSTAAKPETVDRIIHLVNNDPVALSLILDMIAGRRLGSQISARTNNRARSIYNAQQPGYSPKRTRQGNGGYGR